MAGGPGVFCLSFVMLFYGCSEPSHSVELKYKATTKTPQLLALYEGWFGPPKHIAVGYSSHDPATVRNQINKAKQMGISAFVVDWYGDREPYIDQSYALLQGIAAKQHFNVAMMYEETTQEAGATDEAIADLTMFHDTYLAPNAPGQPGLSHLPGQARHLHLSQERPHRLGQGARGGRQVEPCAPAHQRKPPLAAP